MADETIDRDETAKTGEEPPAPTTPAAADGLQFTNTNRWGTRQLVILALMCAISVLLSFIEFPIFPAAPFLKYDASIMPAMVSGFAFGPVGGIAVGIIASLIHGILMGDYPGALMNVIVVVFYVTPAALIYKKAHSWKGAVLALVIGCITSTLGAIAANLLVTPTYMGVPIEAVIGMILPILTPFNLLKAALNSVLTLLVYKSISNLITPKKKQVKGR